jgi:hypothetical protein
MMHTKTILLSLLLSLCCVPWVASTELAEEELALTTDLAINLASDEVSIQQAPEPVKKTLSDEEILQSLDNISDELDSDIFTLDTSELPHENSSQQALEQDHPEAFEDHNLLNHHELGGETLDDMDVIDNFDELSLDEVFKTDDIIEQTNSINDNIISTMPLLEPEESKPANNTIETGNEEKLINDLDNSDLMDYLEGVDVWNKDIADDGIDLD